MATIVYKLEDEWHAEDMGEFATRESALAEARRRSALPWDGEENQPPCTNWRSCGRRLELVVYDASQPRWRELSREPVVRISAKGVRWEAGHMS